MRILHVIPYMHPSAGGPPVVVENFVRETSRLGHRSEIISTPQFCHGDERTLLQRLNELAPTTFLSQLGIFASLHGPTRRQFGESIRAVDIVHLHTLWNPINVIARQECTRHRRPYVLMPHGMLDPYSLTVKRWRKALYLWAIERRNILAAQRLIYTTEEEMRLAAIKSLSPPKGVVIPLGGDAPCEDAEELASGFLERFPRARGRRQLLFLGRLHFKKGLDRILMVLPAIARVFSDVLLTVVGDGTPEFEAMLKSAITAQKLDDNVMMTGRLEGAAKWGAYASAKLFLLPSRQENFAITVAEAMQMGVPVVISNRVNTWPYVKAAGAGVVLDEERMESSLEHAILSLLQDCSTLRLMGKRCQEYARKNLTWAGAASRLLNCYDDVLNCARPRDPNR
jgi:glycosyltransferase involved in cell wall biosynthesis